MNSSKAFLSYVKENEPIVRFLDQVLTDYGIGIVTNYGDIDGGSNWKRTLKQLIENSGYFVACFSKEFNEREKTVLYRELDYAIECAKDYPFDRKWLIPVRINECSIPSIEIGLQGLLTDLQRIDLFPSAKWHEGVESIVRTIDKRLIINPQEALASPREIEILKKLGFDMGEYTCNEQGDIKFSLRREYWSQSKSFIVTPARLTHPPFKLENYITAIVSGTREGILSEIRLSLTISNHSDKDNAYDSLIEKCNELCIELCGQSLSNEIMSDLIEIKNSFTHDWKPRPHALYTNNNYRLEGININMHNEVSHQSTLNEKSVRFRFHITRISFTS